MVELHTSVGSDRPDTIDPLTGHEDCQDGASICLNVPVHALTASVRHCIMTAVVPAAHVWLTGVLCGWLICLWYWHRHLLKMIGKRFYRKWVKSSFEQFITTQTRVGSTDGWIISQNAEILKLFFDNLRNLWRQNGYVYVDVPLVSSYSAFIQ